MLARCHRGNCSCLQLVLHTARAADYTHTCGTREHALCFQGLTVLFISLGGEDNFPSGGSTTGTAWEIGSIWRTRQQHLAETLFNAHVRSDVIQHWWISICCVLSLCYTCTHTCNLSDPYSNWQLLWTFDFVPISFIKLVPLWLLCSVVIPIPATQLVAPSPLTGHNTGHDSGVKS